MTSERMKDMENNRTNDKCHDDHEAHLRLTILGKSSLVNEQNEK